MRRWIKRAFLGKIKIELQVWKKGSERVDINPTEGANQELIRFLMKLSGLPVSHPDRTLESLADTEGASLSSESLR